jgi:hypothetical protein
MRIAKQFQVKARKPTNQQFGDFVITDINLDNKQALAVFGDNAKAEIDITAIVPQLSCYSKSRKRFYVRIV